MLGLNFKAISFKEISMLILGMALVYGLYYLRTNDQIYAPTTLSTQTVDRLSVESELVETIVEPKVIPPAVLETVEIPDWLASKDDYDLSNLTADDLLDLAQISHQQNHDFFPDNQNTLVYLLKAKELGVESSEIDQLLTTLHASLYDQAEQAINNYDAMNLTALTARLKSIDDQDPKISIYTNQIGVIYTLQRLSGEITGHIENNRMYEADQNDAVHTLITALNVDDTYQPLLDLKTQTLNQIQVQAIRAAQELDFSIADEQVSFMRELDPTHEITTNTITDIQAQKQNRFAYLDQQFYAAINNLNLNRAARMIDELSELEIAASQLSGYQALFEKTQLYGPHEISDQFNDFLNTGGTGPAMVVMPTGSFYMGTQTGAKHQRPRHLVEIDYGFAVAKHEVTVGEFKQFISATNYQTTAEKIKRTEIYDEGTGRFKDKSNINWRHDFLGKQADSNLPVIHISWQDAKAYADWLSSATGEPYRLPSETEFEYLLNATNAKIYPWGDDEPSQIWGNFSGAKDKFKRSRIKWREGFSDYEDGYWGPAPVGSFIQSLFGLYDLSGNVMEWVEDCWHDSYTRAPRDGSAWVNRGCESRVIRGGNWASANAEYRIHHRVKANVEFTDPRIGFRVAKTFSY